LKALNPLLFVPLFSVPHNEVPKAFNFVQAFSLPPKMFINVFHSLFLGTGQPDGHNLLLQAAYPSYSAP
jgi:hypothetical protein